MATDTKDTKAFYNTEIPGNWEVKKLHEIADVRDGTHESPKYFEHGVKFLTSKNIKNGELDFSVVSFITQEDAENFNKRSKVDKGDILMSMIGTIGNSVLVDFEPDFCIKNVGLIKPKNIDRYFLIQFFHSPIFQNYLERNLDGGIQKFISLGGLRDIPIPLPPIPEQKAIAQLLITADAAIQTTEKLIAQKELRKKWLMQQLLTGKKRLKGFDGEWKEIHIRDVAKEVSIRNKSDKQLTVLSCTKYDGLVPSLEYFGRKIFADDVSTYKIVPKNHFAYATNHIEEGSIGYQEILDEALISPMYTVFKTDKTVNDNFFYKILKSHPLVYQYQNRMEGSIDRRGGLRWDGFSIIKIKLPSYEEQTAIAQVLQAADKEISLLKAKAEKLREQKKGLMQQLLTGKVRLKIKE